MRSILVLLILVMIGLNGKGQSVTALPDSVLSQCCLEVTLLNGNVTTVDWVFIQYITRDGTGTKLFVEYAPNFGGIQWETQIRIQDDFDAVIERSKFIILPFTVGSTDYGIHRNWIANIEENTTTGGTWIYGRFGTPTKRKFSAVEDYETLKALLLACRPRAIVVAENGLYAEGDTVRMGGILIEDTRIETNAYNFQVKDTLTSQEFGIDYNTPGTNDTTAYWARRTGSFRNIMQMGSKYWKHEITDTVSGLYSRFSHFYNSLGEPFLQHLIFNPSDPLGGTSWSLFERANISLTVSKEDTNPYYTHGLLITPTQSSIGNNESGSGDPGNGVSMGAIGYGTTEFLFLKTKNVDGNTATVGQFLQLRDSITGEVEFATIDLSPYISGSGTTNYIPKFTGAQSIGNSNLSDDNTRVRVENGKPFSLAKVATTGLPTGAKAYMLYDTTGNGIRWYNATRWSYALESTFARGTAGSVFFADANGQVTEDNTAFYRDPAGWLRVRNLNANTVANQVLAIFQPQTGGRALSILYKQDPFNTGINDLSLNFNARAYMSSSDWYWTGRHILGSGGGTWRWQSSAYSEFNYSSSSPFYVSSGAGMDGETLKHAFTPSGNGIGSAVELYQTSGNANIINHNEFFWTLSNSIRGKAYGSVFRVANNSRGTFALTAFNDGRVLIGSSSSNDIYSANLSIGGTTRGFLPPRLTTAQRDALGTVIQEVVLTAAGSGYTSPAISITGGGGSGATAAIFTRASPSVINSITLTNPGSGYTSAPTVTITGSTGSGATAVAIMNSPVDGLTIFNTTTGTPQVYSIICGCWRDEGAYQSDNLHVVDSVRFQNTPAHASIAGLATFDGNKWVGMATLGTGLSYSGGVLSATGGSGGGNSILDSLGNGSILIDANGNDLEFDDLDSLRFTIVGGNEIALDSNEIEITGLLTAKQESYYEITSTSSPQTLSSTYSDNLINQGGTQATFTLEMPPSPVDGQVVTITYNNAISTLTIDGNGTTIVGSAVVTAVAGSQRKFKYYAAASAWIKIY